MTIKTVNKIWFNVGPYDGLIGYPTRSAALSNKIAGETLVGIDLNKNQSTVLTKALTNAFSAQQG